MERRSFLRASVVGVATLGSLAGCLGGSKSPPRRSEVFDELTVNSGTLQIPLVEQPQVESRADVAASLNVGGKRSLSVVGRARAAKGGGRGSGATGRATGGHASAPTGRHGRAIFHGDGDDDEWRENHSDEVKMYPATHTKVGVAYFGSADQFADDPPEPGPVDWDETWSNPDKQTVTYDAVEEGWYRVGSKLEARNAEHDFGWEAVDFEVDQNNSGYEVESPWKVSPRL